MDLRNISGTRWYGGRGPGLIQAAVAACALGLVPIAHAEVALEGTEYNVVGRINGDQTHPAVTFQGSRGYVAWQDNSTDGSGLGIRARRIEASGSASSEAFRVNESASDDQEAVAVATLKDGSTAFAWLGGKRGQQGIFVRVLSPDGTFVRGETRVSAAGSDCRAPSIAALAGGGAAVVWSAQGADGDGLGIVAQRLSASGLPVGPSIAVNEYTWDNQRSPQVAAASDGSFAVAWVSDLQNGNNRADVYVRSISADGVAGAEYRVNSGTAPCSYPTLASVGQGWVVAWSAAEISQEDSRFTINARWLDANGFPAQAVKAVSGVEGNHTRPCIAVSAQRLLVSWTGTKVDASGVGIGGRVFTVQGEAVGPALPLNAVSRGDQMTPAVSGLGDGRFLAVWSNWSGLDKGMDLSAQRLAPDVAPLVAPGAPVVSGLSSWQVRAAWAPVSGLPVTHYEVYFDGSETPETTTDSFWSSPDVLPATTHTVQVAYVLGDGRRSPKSPLVAGKSWGKDTNGDGLPDDWQSQFFGTSAVAWPSPAVDTDKDGVSNRDEFLAGTDPKNAADVLKVSLSQTEQGPELSWSALPGGVYQLQMSTNLENWDNVGGYRFSAGSTDSLVLQEAPLNAYFRVNRIR